MTPPNIVIHPPTGVAAEPFSFGKLWRLAGCFGPAAVVASLSLGAGETIMVTGLGSWSGFHLFWLLILSVVIRAVFVMYLVGRYTAITGQLFPQRIAALPGPRGWLLVLFVLAELAVLSTGLTAIAKPCGNLGVHLMNQSTSLAIRLDLANPQIAGIWENGITTAFLAAAMLVSLASSYGSMEKQQIVICGVMVVGTAIATLIVGPNLWDMFQGAVRIGDLPPAPEWAPPTAKNEYALNLATIFGYIGGSLSGYIAYSSWVGLHGWGLAGHPDAAAIREYADRTSRFDYLPTDREQIENLNRQLTPLRSDVIFGAAVLMSVTAAFLAAGATVLYPRQMSPGAGQEFALLTKQAIIWEQIHPLLVPVYYISVLLALWGTLATVPEAVARVTHELLSAVSPAAKALPFRTVMTVLVGWFFLSSQFWIWGGFGFNLLTQLGALVTVNLGVGIVCLLATYYNATLPKGYRSPWWLTAGGVVSGIILLIAFVATAAGMISKWQSHG